VRELAARMADADGGPDGATNASSVNG
jgi:hypothetical protein